MPDALNKNRIDWIDMAKGYGMLAVIIAHIVTGPLHTWIYTFHMPLFFFLSGYVFSKKASFNEFIVKKAKSLILPYFTLGIPMVAFKVLYDFIFNNFSVDATIELIKAFVLQKRQWTLWYIACLFFLNVIFYIITKCIKSNILRGAIVVLSACVGLIYYKVGGLPLPWNIDACFMAIPFFFGGFVLKENSSKIDNLLSQTKNKILLFLAFGLINVVFGYLNIRMTGKGLEMFYSEYANPLFTYISAFAGIFAVIIFSKFFTVKPIKFIGENSLVYYAWHQTIMIPVTTLGFSFLGFESPTDITQPYYWCYKFVQLVVILFTLTIATLIIEKTNLRVLLGKKRINKNN